MTEIPEVPNTEVWGKILDALERDQVDCSMVVVLPEDSDVLPSFVIELPISGLAGISDEQPVFVGTFSQRFTLMTLQGASQGEKRDLVDALWLLLLSTRSPSLRVEFVPPATAEEPATLSIVFPTNVDRSDLELTGRHDLGHVTSATLLVGFCQMAEPVD
jgi:hypothetical protein